MKKTLVFIVCALLGYSSRAQTYQTSAPMNDSYGYRIEITVPPNHRVVWSAPDLGSNLRYTWEHGAFPTASVSGREITFTTRAAGQSGYVNCYVSAIDSQNPSVYFIKRFTWLFKSEDFWLNGYNNDVNPKPDIYLGSYITFIIPNYGSPAHGINNYWFAQGTLQVVASTQTSVTARAASLGTGNVYSNWYVNGRYFGGYSKYFNVVSSGGGGGGGCTCCEAAIFPNPTGSTFTFKAKDAKGEEVVIDNQRISITDASTGKVVFDGKFVSKDFDFANLVSKSGVYYVAADMLACPQAKTKIIVEK
jgi:hypothetical protein